MADFSQPLIILIALLCGLASRAVGLPALIGYLTAGFVLHEIGVTAGSWLEQLANLGITLLLFSIGLKLDVRALLKLNVWGTTLVHMVVSQGFLLLLLIGLAQAFPALNLSMAGAAVIAFALTFSSTVFVIQTLQERGELQSNHAILAIGILVVQDLIAVSFLAITAGKVPSIYALGLLLIIPARPLILKLLSVSGYGELLTLLGLALAIGAAEISEVVGLKGDLGALLIGAMLAGEQKTKALAANLIQLKDLFLVGFFLSIGLGGWPPALLIGVAVVLGLVSVGKPLLYFFLMTRLHTTPRSAVLASSVLSNHSEFGLIVIAVAAGLGWVAPVWSSTLSIALAISFLLAAPMSKASHGFYRKYRDQLLGHRSMQLMDTYEPTDHVNTVILGMGRVGTGAYEALAPRLGEAVLGVETSLEKVTHHQLEQRRVICADASDPDFWVRINLKEVEVIMLALTNHPENIMVAELIRSMGYAGDIASVVRHEEHSEQLRSLGISAFNLYAQAGAGFAAHASNASDSGDQ
ncbi:cation:proton antiporter domain-containing protein [Luminiphilus sp. nBUS_07]|uniref:cation:proton antiporter domain-containing protein n=1 Tax=Luminiphilus sp. nBUS_07 TaxID=3395314 RepID=UPI003EBCFD84